jgi:hypothetical protein
MASKVDLYGIHYSRFVNGAPLRLDSEGFEQLQFGPTLEVVVKF